MANRLWRERRADEDEDAPPPRRADEDEDTQRQYWNDTMNQWGESASNWSAPAAEPDRYAFYDRAVRSRNPVIADEEEAGNFPEEWSNAEEASAAGEADPRWEDPEDADRFEADEYRRESLRAVAEIAADIFEARTAVPEDGIETAVPEDGSSRGSWTTELSRDAAESVDSLGSWMDFGGQQSSRAPEAAVAAGDGEEPELSSEDEAAVADQMLGVSQFGFVLATHGGGCTSTVQACDSELVLPLQWRLRRRPPNQKPHRRRCPIVRSRR